MIEILTSSATVVNEPVTTAVSGLLTIGLKGALLVLTTMLTWGAKVALSSLKSTWKRAIAARLVAYAEQRVLGDEEKRAYVAQKLHEHFPRISEEEANHLLEEAVVNLKAGLDSASVG